MHERGQQGGPVFFKETPAFTRPSQREEYFSKEAKMLRTDRKFAYNAQSLRDHEKICSKCRRWGALDDFPADGRMGSGRSSWCRPCHANAVRDWRRRNRERENARRRTQKPQEVPNEN